MQVIIESNPKRGSIIGKIFKAKEENNVSGNLEILSLWQY